MLGAWSKSLADYKTKYFGRRNKSTKSMYFRLPIDTNFLSILLLISVLFSWIPYRLLIGGRYRWAGRN